LASKLTFTASKLTFKASKLTFTAFKSVIAFSEALRRGGILEKLSGQTVW